MSIYFNTDADFDLDVIRVMGVSVKTNDNPIGYFGTGLKFAIATLLRTGHKVTLWVDNKKYPFTARKGTIRGEDFDVVYMGEEKLAFTTQLGKNWEVWQAYRELYSNTLDEDGTVGYASTDTRVRFKVDGAAFENVHAQRSTIFLTTAPIHQLEGVDVHAGQSEYVYYRGVRAMTLNRPSHYTYNITESMALTEDRNLKSEWDVGFAIANAIPRVNDPAMWDKVFDWDTNSYELSLDLHYCSHPSEAFLAALFARKNDAKMDMALRAMMAKNMKGDDFDRLDVETNRQKIDDAFEILGRLNCSLEKDSVTWVRDLGPNIAGQVREGKIFVPEQTINNGAPFLAITLYEEWLHRDLKLKDCSRAMQQHLFDKLLGFVS